MPRAGPGRTSSPRWPARTSRSASSATSTSTSSAEGRHYALHTKLGAHPFEVEGVRGTYFAVWAPDAVEVSVIGDFNGWRP